MIDYQERALEKLEKEYKAGSYDKYASAMKSAVLKALKDFVKQDAEFAQAVVQGGSFEDCMKAVGKCVKGNSISDAEAWGAAVRFYFPGAEIRVTMEIDLCASVRDKNDEATGADTKLIDLSEFF